MTDRHPGASPDDRRPARDSAGRDDRLRAALRANLQRRKEQARARAADDRPGDAGLDSKDE